MIKIKKRKQKKKIHLKWLEIQKHKCINLKKKMMIIQINNENFM